MWQIREAGGVVRVGIATLLPGQQLHRFPERALYGAACALVTPDSPEDQRLHRVLVREDEKSGRSFRRRRRILAGNMDGSGATFLLIGMLDISLAWYPFNLGNSMEIRDHQLDVRLLPVVTLGLALLAGYQSPRLEAQRADLFVLLILAALMILAALVIYALNLPRHSGRCRTRCSGRAPRRR